MNCPNLNRQVAGFLKQIPITKKEIDVQLLFHRAGVQDGSRIFHLGR